MNIQGYEEALGKIGGNLEANEKGETSNNTGGRRT